MKKITTIILTAILLASLTGCRSVNEPSNSVPDDDKLINVIAPADTDEKTPESTADGENEKPEKDEEQSAPEDEKAPETAPEDKTENTDKNKTEDNNEQTAAPEKTENPAAALPLKDYPDGSYFTYDGKPCEDHLECDWTGECNCVKFDRAIQAMGFAKYVYFEVTGKHISLDDKTEVDADLTADTARSSLMGVPVGTYIAAETNNEKFHAMIAADTNENGITVYQANYGEGCRVSLMTLTWAEFADRFPHLDYYVK